jgi:HEAT repeat protein
MRLAASLVAVAAVVVLVLSGCKPKPEQDGARRGGSPGSPGLSIEERVARESAELTEKSAAELVALLTSPKQLPQATLVVSDSGMPQVDPRFVEAATELQAKELAVRQALANMGAQAVPALTEALSSADPAARASAAEVLGDIGREAASAKPKLLELTKDADPKASAAASDAVTKIDMAQ